MARFIKVHPVLPARNVSEAIDFYTNKLSFKLVFKDEENDPKYAGIKRDNVELHLQWHDEKDFDSVEKLVLRLLIEDIDVLFEEYKNFDFVGMNNAPIKTAWGTYEFSFFDLNNNALFFYRDL